MKKHLFLSLLLLISLGLVAQKTDLKQLMQQRNEYYFTFNLNGNDDLNTIARTISVDQVNGATVTAYANNQEFAEFQKLGYEVTLQTPPSMLEEVAMWDGSNRASYDWDSYPTYQAYEDMMFAFQTDHPDKCEIITLGTLPSSRKIMVFFLFMVIMVISMGTLMYMVEGNIKGTPFTDIPTSIYWAVVTMTTVGYGDIAPVTPVGRFLSAIIMLMGYTILAVPTGIVSAQFVHDHGKTVTPQHKCKECGSPLPQKAHFCPHCGVEVKG